MRLFLAVDIDDDTRQAAAAWMRLATIDAAEDAVTARPYTPHLTLGRVRTPSGALGRALRAAMTPIPATFGRFTVRDVTLYESRLSPKGPTYVASARIPLTHDR